MSDAHSVAWLDRSEYPFASRFFETPVGRMHYVDEGAGPPVVFVHGNPSWSFEYRKVIKRLAGSRRCIAPDHIGFGLSDKPSDWSYLPSEHAVHFADFMESLNLRRVTLVVGDWGGPIGLSYALAHPDRIAGVVVTNTWMWPVQWDWYYQAFSKFVGGPLGRRLIRKRNFFARTILRATFGDKTRLTPEIHRHYLMPLEIPQERKGCWVFPREIIGSTAWLGLAVETAPGARRGADAHRLGDEGYRLQGKGTGSVATRFSRGTRRSIRGCRPFRGRGAAFGAGRRDRAADRRWSLSFTSLKPGPGWVVS
ncbi:MAG: alpha/beta fold hydrolase [Polyangia bacterium]